MLRSGETESGIDRLRRQVVNMPLLFALDNLDIPVAMRFPEKAHRHLPARSLREAVILAAQEVAGMYGDEVQERSFALNIAEPRNPWRERRIKGHYWKRESSSRTFRRGTTRLSRVVLRDRLGVEVLSA